jgi:hypothetical protein
MRRYLFTVCPAAEEGTYWASMPRLVMVVSHHHPMDGPDAFDIHLFKFITSNTAANMLSTPIRHPPRDHSGCSSDPRFARKLTSACRLAALPVVRPIMLVHELHFNGGRITRVPEHRVASLSPPHLTLGLHDTRINVGLGCCVNCDHDRPKAETAIELMRLGCKRSDPSDLQRVEFRLLREQREVEDGVPGCMLKHRHTEWHLAITGAAFGVWCFIKKVGSRLSRLLTLTPAEAYLAQLREEVVHVPELLQYRLLVRIQGVMGHTSDFEYLREQLSNTYIDNVSDCRQLLPSNSNTPTIMRMNATVRMSTAITQAQRDSAPPHAPSLPESLDVNVTATCTAYKTTSGVYIDSMTEIQETPGLTIQRDADIGGSYMIGYNVTQVGNDEPIVGPLTEPIEEVWDEMMRRGGAR